MKKSKRVISLLICSLLLISLLSGCKQQNGEIKENGSEDKKSFTVGCMPLNQPAVEIIEEMIKDEGYEMEVVVFDGNHLPAEALKDGNIDCLILNHLPWINTFNKEKGTNLMMLEPYIYYSYFAVYSSRYDSLEDIPNGAKIGIPGDPTNMDRALRVLQDIDFIELGEKTGEFYSLVDIKENKKDLELLETEVTATVRSYEDLDAIITFSSTMRMADLDAKSFLYEDVTSVNYPVGFVVNPEDKDADWVKKAIEMTQRDEFIEKFNKHYQGAYQLFKDKK